MNAVLRCGPVLLLAAGLIFGQGVTRPSFEVASIKLWQRPADDRAFLREAFVMATNHGVQVGPSQTRCTGTTLKDLISFAYRVESSQISAPEWLSNARYDILAKIPVGVPANLAPEMLQSLLEDRFKLTYHRASQEYDVYVLSALEGGLKLLQKPGRYEFRRGSTSVPETMATLANELAQATGRMVLDQTLLKGEYMVPQDVRSLIQKATKGQLLRRPLEPEKATEVPSVGELRRSLKSLGLSFELRKQALSLLIIDHAEKTPTED